MTFVAFGDDDSIFYCCWNDDWYVVEKKKIMKRTKGGQEDQNRVVKEFDSVERASPLVEQSCKLSVLY